MLLLLFLFISGFDVKLKWKLKQKNNNLDLVGGLVVTLWPEASVSAK